MSLHLGQLKRNLQDIYRAAHQTGNSTLPLVANFSGTRFYPARHFQGRLWRGFYCLSELLVGCELQQSSLQKAISNTHALFLKQLTFIQPHATAYATYLKRCGQGYGVREKDYFVARQVITKWNKATSPFIEYMQHSSSPALKTWPFLIAEAKRLYDFYKIIALEGISEGVLPLASLKKVLKDKPLNSIDHKMLDQWIKKMNGRAGAVHFIHQGLQGIASQYIKEVNSNEKDTAASLEMVLEDKGCKVFQHADAEHMRWRQCLKKGDCVRGKDRQMVLGAELIHTTQLMDRTRVFALEGEDDYVVLFAQNRAALGIRSLRHRVGVYFGIPPVSLIGVSDDGSFALAERLSPLCAHVWKSREGCLSLEDQPLINIIQGLLRWLVSSNFTPTGFTPDALMLDASNRLKALKPMSKERFDFNALEDFVFKCSAGNRTIHHHLMTKTGLSEHATARFYHHMMAIALKGEVFEAEDLACIYKIGDPKVVDRAIELAKKMVSMRQEICSKVRALLPEYSEGETKGLYKAVGKALMECHKQSQAVSIMWTSLEQEVVEKVVKLINKR